MKTRFIILYALLLVCVMSGCKLGPKIRETADVSAPDPGKGA